MDFQTILRQFQRRAREPQTAPDTQSNQRAQEAQGSQGHQGTPQLVRETPAMQGARDAQRPQGAQGAQRPQATKRAQGDAMNAAAKSQDGRQMQDSQMPDDQHYEHPLDQDPEEQLKRFREKHAYKETFHKELTYEPTFQDEFMLSMEAGIHHVRNPKRREETWEGLGW